MGLIIKGPPSQGFSHHFPHDFGCQVAFNEVPQVTLIGEDPWWERRLTFDWLRVVLVTSFNDL